jgi:hypothetical protein
MMRMKLGLLMALTVALVLGFFHVVKMWVDPVPMLPYTPQLSIAPLQTIIGDAATDAEALARIGAYYDRHDERLAVLFNEPDGQRLRGLFAMYVVGNAVDYGVVDEGDHADSLIGYAQMTTAHCGVYARWLLVVGAALGLAGEGVLLDNGNHAVVDFVIDGKRELFDPTTNVWASEGTAVLLAGAARDWRVWYHRTPELGLASWVVRLGL